MADESVQIKQEPLEQNYAAEMDDVDADATCSSGVNIECSFSMSGKRACSQNEVLDIVDLNPDIIIKEEPDFYDDNYAETVLESVEAKDIHFSSILKSSKSMPENVQIKAEPEDNFDYPTEIFNSSENLPKYTNDASAEQKQLHNLSCHFQVLDEHENIITVTAADLPPDDGELAFIEKLKTNLKPTEVKKSKKIVICKLCMKRCTQDMNYAYHMEQHRRNRLFCIRKTCESWFSSLEECEAHEYGLHNITIFKCNVCNHKFHNFEQLCQHKVKMHSKLQRFICSICRDWFISIQELHEHWASLLDRCGRIVNIQEETPEQIIKLLQERKAQTESRNSYKIKSASTAIPVGLKLKIKPLLDNSTSQGITNIPPNLIEIKKEPMDFETVIPDFPLKPKTESLNTNEVQFHKSSTLMNGLPIVPVKLRLRKFPLSLTTVENEEDNSTPAILQYKRNSLGQALAQRITAKFSLKSCRKCLT
uniref:GDNF-inducible zinc finger protein 1 n=2 Tax=Ceratitis capitata TaxID=7213 RepID=W8B552_CERCA